ncbi:MAG: hypothetical protein U0802_07920 [Candidatus Binatia bacterium]
MPPPASRPAPLGLAFRDLRLAVASADATQLAWLLEFLSPAFTAVAGDAADCRVEVIADAERLAAARAAVGDGAVPVTCLVQDRELVRLPAARDGDALVVRHDEVGIAYRVSGDRREVTLFTAPGADARGALMKVVREIAMSAAWMPRGLILHAAAFAVGDRAVLVAGPKRAGKTSLLLHALRLPGARLLANDRVALALDGAGAVAHGLPTIVTLRPDTVARLLPDDAARRSALRHHFVRTVAEAEARPPVDDPALRQLSCSPAPARPAARRRPGQRASGRGAAAAHVDPTARHRAAPPARIRRRASGWSARSSS